VLSNGENVEPLSIEEAVLAICPVVDQIMLGELPLALALPSLPTDSSLDAYSQWARTRSISLRC